jgi:hypothetical protein
VGGAFTGVKLEAERAPEAFVTGVVILMRIYTDITRQGKKEYSHG